MQCEDLHTKRLQQICRGESELPTWKANVYRAQWGIEPLPVDDEITYVIHSGTAVIPIPAHKPVTGRIHGPSAGRCAGCDTPNSAVVIPAGPGAELSKAMTAKGLPSCQACKDLAKQMDAWGAAECRDRLAEIVGDIMPRARDWVAKEHPWASALFPDCLQDLEIRRRVTNYVVDAIEADERKQALRDRVFRPLPKPTPVATVANVVDQCQVVVKSFRRFDCLQAFLESLWKHYPGIPVLIADDSLRPHETYPESVAGIQSNPLVTWLQLPFDSGLSYGRNECVKVASKPYLILCDDDYVVTEKTRLERMLSVLQVTDVSLVAGLVEESGHTRNWVGNYTIAGDSLKVSRLKGQFRRAGGVSYKPTDVTWNFFIAETESLRRVPWDDRLKIAAEHVDFFISRFRAGEKSAYTPESCMRHSKVRTPQYNGFRERKDRFQSIMRQNQGLKEIQPFSPMPEAFHP